MIADLHCHYPMHVLPDDDHPHRATAGWLGSLADHLRAKLIGIAAHFFNDPSLSGGWRVDLDGVEQGEARIVCSVLYWPAGEFRIAKRPASNAFEDLKNLLCYVMAELRKLDPTNQRHVIVGNGTNIVEDGRVNFIHCVEGAFNLGRDEGALDANVKWLADQGVLYITIAHLFFQGVSTSAPALPVLTDWEYSQIFDQPRGVGLTDLAKELVRAMYKHNVLVDISHMSERAISDTFRLVATLDDKYGREPTDYPVLATHVGMRAANRDTQVYNLTDGTAKDIKDRGGLIGLIMAQHQLGTTTSEDESRKTLKQHLDAIERACGGLDCCAIGSDLDGFIKPTLFGFDYARDFGKLAKWIEGEVSTAEAEKILYRNASTLVEKVFAARGRGTSGAVGQSPTGPP